MDHEQDCDNCVAHVIEWTQLQFTVEDMTEEIRRMKAKSRKYRNKLRAAKQLIDMQDALITMLMGHRE